MKMSSVFDFLRRTWSESYPTEVGKSQDAIRIGLFGASWIAPRTIIRPAKSHPDIIVAAIAARDPQRAAVYAKKHKIPIVHKTYDDLLADPSIDAVYIALPNGLHYEWAIKSLQAGKHVLLEKPATSNAEEAQKLFTHEVLKKPGAPVILETFYFRFHPAWQSFLSLLDPANIVEARSEQYLLKYFFNKDDIRFNYKLAGGALMDFGTYNVMTLRQIFDAEPAEILSASARLGPAEWDQKCDQAIKASWRWPNGGVGSIEADLVATGGYPLPGLTKNLPRLAVPKMTVKQRPTRVDDEDSKKLPAGQEHVVARSVVFLNMAAPHLWHRISIEDHHIIRSVEGETPIRSWVEKDVKTAYTFPTEEPSKGVKPGKDICTIYRCLLDEFVNKVRGREVSKAWIDGEDSIAQMKVIDGVYVKAGLPVRPTSEFQG